jgi:hypothetical protein
VYYAIPSPHYGFVPTGDDESVDNFCVDG